MKKIVFRKKLKKFSFSLSPVLFGTAIMMLLSFTMHSIADDFLKKLGITKAIADEKISESLLGGFVNTYGLNNVKNIAVGDRAALTKDLLQYIKQYAASPDFKKVYMQMKEERKPTVSTIQTPEALRKSGLEAAEKSVKDIEGYIKNADASLKPVFEKSLEEAKKNLKDQKDPNNEMYLSYASSYPEMVKSNEESNRSILQNWEEEYPADPMQYVKKQLESFLDNTAGIDFNAETVNKNGKKIFVKQEYERKGHYWKMAYRAGKEVVEPSRSFVTQWLQEIK